MKPFCLEAAKRGEPIVCRDGTPTNFIVHVPEASNGRKVVAMRDNGIIYIWHESGEFDKDEPTNWDLFMAPKTYTVWINIYGNNAIVYYSKQDADKAANPHRVGNRAYPVEIEE